MSEESEGRGKQRREPEGVNARGESQLGGILLHQPATSIPDLCRQASSLRTATPLPSALLHLPLPQSASPSNPAFPFPLASASLLQETYISVPGSVAAGWTDVGKAYLHFDIQARLGMGVRWRRVGGTEGGRMWWRQEGVPRM